MKQPITIIISSKQLANDLNKIDLETYWITEILFGTEFFDLVTTSPYETYSIQCNLHEGRNTDMKHHANWNFIKKLVNQVDEQPIVLKISETKVDVIFQY